ncbi:hypothetical protein FMM05_06125 [Flavobacterium zepuense]|uniref:Uncharacterized protein n=1 Tax=Flavobacterium zepuense TaxID=2593302 RepID=A0A552V5S2_9FLAO|nr:hypothetical protein FMM05_06125 [Flavobacterium zepuense]
MFYNKKATNIINVALFICLGFFLFRKYYRCQHR